MALSRKCEATFVHSPVGTLAKATLTAGLIAPLQHAWSLDCWRRLEWVQYAELARWLRDRTGSDAAQEMIAFAEQAASQPSPWRRTQIYVLAALAMLIALGIATPGDWRLLVTTVFAPLWTVTDHARLLPLAFGYGIVLAFAWLSLLRSLMRHQADVVVWLTRAVVLLAAHDRRPVVFNRRAASVVTLLVAIVIGGLLAPWMGLLIVAVDARNRYIIATRAVRLAFIERMLEFMDASGLPVEFDVEEMEPDAIAATLA